MSFHAVTPHRTIPNLRRVTAGIDQAILELCSIRRDLTDAHAHAVDALAGPGSSLGGSGHGSDISDPTGRQALTEDPAAMFLARLARYADAEPRKLRPLADEVASWRARTVRDLDRKPTLVAGRCQACEIGVSGKVNDRIKSGYCEACYKAWCRAGRPERATYERTRPNWDEAAEVDGGEAA